MAKYSMRTPLDMYASTLYGFWMGIALSTKGIHFWRSSIKLFPENGNFLLAKSTKIFGRI